MVPAPDLHGDVDQISVRAFGRSGVREHTLEIGYVLNRCKVCDSECKGDGGAATFAGKGLKKTGKVKNGDQKVKS